MFLFSPFYFSPLFLPLLSPFFLLEGSYLDRGCGYRRIGVGRSSGILFERTPPSVSSPHSASNGIDVSVDFLLRKAQYFPPQLTADP